MTKSAKNVLFPNQQPVNTAVLVLDDCNTLSFAAGVDPMRATNRLAGRRLFNWQYVTTTGQPAKLTSDVMVPGTALQRLTSCDLLIVIAGFGLERHATPALRASLRRIAATGTTLAGIDGGPWLLADAGLLDGRRATTHWEDLDRFAARFPAVTTLRDRFHIDGARMTSGGALPTIDMMLALISARFGAKLAARVAGVFIHDTGPNPARTQIRSGGHTGHNLLTSKISARMEQTLDAPVSIATLARQFGTSPRSLQAQFQTRLNTTPQAHYLTLRLNEALRLVSDTDMRLLDVALATGFSSGSSFARAFKSAHNTSARALRQKRNASLSAF